MNGEEKMTGYDGPTSVQVGYGGGGSSGSQLRRGYSEPEEEPSDARINAQLQFTGEQLIGVHNRISELEDLLDSVLLPASPTGSTVDSPQRKPASVISNLLDDYNGSLLDIQGRLERLMKRVQL